MLLNAKCQDIWKNEATVVIDTSVVNIDSLFDVLKYCEDELYNPDMTQFYTFNFKITNYNELLHKWAKKQEETECPLEDIASKYCLEPLSQEISW